jgi:hypothetical protein
MLNDGALVTVTVMPYIHSISNANRIVEAIFKSGRFSDIAFHLWLSVAQNHFFLSADRLPNQHLERMAYRPPLKSLLELLIATRSGCRRLPASRLPLGRSCREYLQPD